MTHALSQGIISCHLQIKFYMLPNFAALTVTECNEIFSGNGFVIQHFGDCRCLHHQTVSASVT
jgi:hypothetical protein